MDPQHPDSRTRIERIISHLTTGNYEKFYDSLASNIVWKIEGNHPLSGYYSGIQHVKRDIFERIFQLLHSPMKYHLEAIIFESNMAAVILNSDAVAKNGKHYKNHHCWILQWNPDTHKITQINSFSNENAFNQLFKENEKFRLSA